MKPLSIAQKNDLARTTFIGCRVVVSAALTQSPKKEDVLTAAREFKDFTPANDPH